MANIQNELDKIRSTQYGGELRVAVHDGLKKVNENVEEVPTYDEFNEIKSALNANLGGIETVDAVLDITTGKYVACNNGTLNPSSSSNFYCDYVDVSDAIDHKITIQNLIFNESDDVVAFCAWYDSEQHFIGSLHKSNVGDYGISLSWSLQTVTIQLPSTAVYVRMSGTTQFGSMTADDLTLSYEAPDESGKVYTKIREKLSIAQGTENSGKFIGINSAGNVEPMALPGIEDGDISYAKLDSGLQDSIDEISELQITVSEQLGGTITTKPALDIITGKYIYKENGNLNTNSSFAYCDYIDVSNAIDKKVTITNLIYNDSAGNVAFCAWYDSDKHYIGSLYSGNVSEYGISLSWIRQTVTIQLPSNAAYVRMSINTSFPDRITTDDLALSYSYHSSSQVYDAIEEKLDANHGSANAGKALVVNSHGQAVPTDITINVDTSLSNQGEAADAKATGEAISAVGSDLSNLQEAFDEQFGSIIEEDAELTIITGKYIEDVNGGINTSTEANFYCDYVDVSDAIDHKITIQNLIYNDSSDIKAFCAWYDSDKRYIGSLHKSNVGDYGISLSWSLQTVTIQLPSDTVYVRMSGITQFGSMTTEDLTLSYLHRDSSAIYDLINGKLNENQGSENSGKYLGINGNGNVIPVDLTTESTFTKTGRNVVMDLSEGTKITVTTDAAAVQRMGKNLFRVSATQGDYNGNTSILYDADLNEQWIDIEVKPGGSTYIFRAFYIPVSVGTKITVSTRCLNSYYNKATPIIKLYAGVGTDVLNSGCSGGIYNDSYKGFYGSIQGEPQTYEITSDSVNYVIIGVRIPNGNGFNPGDIVRLQIQAEMGDTATEWEKSVYAIKYPSNNIVKYDAIEGINTFFSTRTNSLSVSAVVNDFVTKVNGKSGTITLNALDVGALPVGWDGYPYNIVRDNRDMTPSIFAASRYGFTNNSGWNINKQFTMLITTDTHGDADRHQHALDYMDAIKPIDIGICMGDMQSVAFGDNDGTWFTNPILAAKKKFYPVIGNHDCGMSNVVGVAATKQQQFDKFFAPLLEKLEMTSLTKTYYKIDATDNLVIIVLDFHDCSDELADENTYVEYHGDEDMSQEQINWLCNTLASIPTGTHVLIITHFLDEVQSYVYNEWTNTEFPQELDDPWQWPDMLPEIIEAWKSGTSLSKTYSPTYSASKGSRIVNVDFTSRGTGIFVGWIHGHTHRDFIKKITAYPTQNVISLATNSMQQGQNGNNDLPRVYGTRTEDLVTVVTIDTIDRKIKMVRIGSQVSYSMQKRDIIAIDY